MHRSRPTALFGVLLALVMMLAACAGDVATTPSPAGEESDGDGAAAETGETASLSGGRFEPSTLTIPAGTSVTFVDGGGHTVTEGSNGTAVDDPIVDEQWSGEPIVVSFDEPGTYDITCRIHPNMNMTVTVEG